MGDPFASYGTPSFGLMHPQQYRALCFIAKRVRSFPCLRACLEQRRIAAKRGPMKRRGSGRD